MGQVLTSGDTDRKPTDPPPPSATPGTFNLAIPRRSAQAPTTPSAPGPRRHRSDPSAPAPTTAALTRRRVSRLPVEFALPQFVLDAGAELDLEGRGVNRCRINADAEEAQPLDHPLHPELIVARVEQQNHL